MVHWIVMTLHLSVLLHLWTHTSKNCAQIGINMWIVYPIQSHKSCLIPIVWKKKIWLHHDWRGMYKLIFSWSRSWRIHSLGQEHTHSHLVVWIHKENHAHTGRTCDTPDIHLNWGLYHGLWSSDAATLAHHVILSALQIIHVRLHALRCISALFILCAPVWNLCRNLPHGHHVQLSSPVLVLLVICYFEGHVTVTQESVSICILCILKTCENKEWTLYIIHRHVHVRNCFALLKTSHQSFQTIAWMVCRSLPSRRIPSSLPGMGAANGRRFVEVGVASRAPGKVYRQARSPVHY